MTISDLLSNGWVQTIGGGLFVIVLSDPLRKAWQAILQRRALNSQKAARKRVRKILDEYKRVWRDRETFKKEPFAAVLTASTDNGYVMVIALFAIYTSQWRTPFDIFVAMAIFGVAILRFSEAVTRRNRILDFAKFREETQTSVLALRKKLNDNSQLAVWWETAFEESLPDARGD